MDPSSASAVLTVFHSLTSSKKLERPELCSVAGNERSLCIKRALLYDGAHHLSLSYILGSTQVAWTTYLKRCSAVLLPHFSAYRTSGLRHQMLIPKLFRKRLLELPIRYNHAVSVSFLTNSSVFLVTVTKCVEG